MSEDEIKENQPVENEEEKQKPRRTYARGNC